VSKRTPCCRRIAWICSAQPLVLITASSTVIGELCSWMTCPPYAMVAVRTSSMPVDAMLRLRATRQFENLAGIWPGISDLVHQQSEAIAGVGFRRSEIQFTGRERLHGPDAGDEARAL
jgi:hypothetical protein